MTLPRSLGDFKRTTTREAMSLKLGALLELAEKTVVVGELGKLMVDEIPTERTEPGAPRAAYNSASDVILSNLRRKADLPAFPPRAALLPSAVLSRHRHRLPRT